MKKKHIETPEDMAENAMNAWQKELENGSVRPFGSQWRTDLGLLIRKAIAQDRKRIAGILREELSINPHDVASRVLKRLKDKP